MSGEPDQAGPSGGAWGDLAREWARSHDLHCPECEYPLVEVPRPVCPECGHLLTPDDLDGVTMAAEATRSREPWWSEWVHEGGSWSTFAISVVLCAALGIAAGEVRSSPAIALVGLAGNGLAAWLVITVLVFLARMGVADFRNRSGRPPSVVRARWETHALKLRALAAFGVLFCLGLALLLVVIGAAV